MSTSILGESAPISQEMTFQPAVWKPWFWLALGGFVLLFSNLRDTIPVAAWIGPALMLRFFRQRRGWVARAAGFAVLWAMWAFQLRGMAPLPHAGYVVFCAMFAVFSIAAYLVDAWLAPRLPGFKATLVFPLIFVTLEFANARLSPYGSWGALAYSQYGDLPLLQIMSVTGMYGVTFLLTWFAAVVNWAWERDFDWTKVRPGALLYAGVLAAVVLWGGTRLVWFAPQGPTVRIASLTEPDIGLFPNDDVARRAMSNQRLTDDELAEIRRRMQLADDDLFTRADREAQAGARIVFWGETNAAAFKQDEAALIERAATLARTRSVYLPLAVAIWNTGSLKPLENKVVMVDPQGQVRFVFFKAHPVPGHEANVSAVSDGRVRTLDTPYGRLAAVICFDMDFPELLKQAGAQQADLLVAPSNDWRAIDPWHTQMATYRAIEQGFNLVRHTSHGLSLAVDYQGRVVGSMDHFATTADRVLVAQVPTRGVRSAYSRIGDVFAWLCVAGLAVLAGLALKRPERGLRTGGLVTSD